MWILFSVIACSNTLKVEEKSVEFADRACACDGDKACIQGVFDAASSEKIFVQEGLSDPAVLEAKYGHNEEIMEAFGRFQVCVEPALEELRAVDR